MKQQVLAVPCLLLHSAAALSSYDYGNSGDQVRFWLNDAHDDADIGQMPFLTGTGFATLPITDCFGKDESPESRYDIAILGAPFDTTTTGRPGARFGPPAIRQGSNQKTYGTSVYTGRDSLRSWAKIVDCGDAQMTWLDNRAAIKTLDKAHRVISGRPAKNSEKSTVPRIITLGGDHTTTLSALRSTHKHWGPVSVIHFDSHIDTWDPSQLGGGISDYAALNHGTFLHFAHEEHLILNSSIHAGIRSNVADKTDIKHDAFCGFQLVTARDLDLLGAKGIIDKIRNRIGDSRIYISVDIDVLDPAFAPGKRKPISRLQTYRSLTHFAATGTPEAGGWSTRELLTVLAGLEGLPLIGGDVVEVAPPYDNNAATTSLAAAEVAFTLLELMVATPVKA